MKLLILLISILSLETIAVFRSSSVYIPEDVVERNYYISNQILQAYPPDSFRFIGFGKSSGIISEFLRQSVENSDDYVLELPIHKYKDLAKNDFDFEKQFQFFDALFEGTSLGNDKNIVVYRVLWEGETLRVFGRAFTKWLEKRGFQGRLMFHLEFFKISRQEKVYFFDVKRFGYNDISIKPEFDVTRLTHSQFSYYRDSIDERTNFEIPSRYHRHASNLEALTLYKGVENRYYQDLVEFIKDARKVYEKDISLKAKVRSCFRSFLKLIRKNDFY